MKKNKEINNLKSEKPMVSRERKRISDIKPKLNSQKESLALVEWKVFLKESDCSYAKKPGNCFIQAAALAKKDNRKMLELKNNNRLCRYEPTTSYTEDTLLNNHIIFNDKRWRFVSQGSVDTNKNYEMSENMKRKKMLYDSTKRPVEVYQAPQLTRKKPSLPLKVLEESEKLPPKVRPNVSSPDKTKTRLPSNVKGVDVCGLTIKIRDEEGKYTN